MVVPPPIAAPCTAATIGLSKAMKALIKRDCGLSSGPGGFFRKSSRSFPAEKGAPAPCQGTPRTLSSFAPEARRAALAMDMSEVIASDLDGEWNVTCRVALD